VAAVVLLPFFPAINSQGNIMSKVKPYIITVKYIGVYSDPKPTEEQILAELNIDPLEITIEEATVAIKTNSTVSSPAPVAEVKPTPAIVLDVPQSEGKPTKLDKIKRNLLPFGTTDLDSNGPSVKILAALYEKPRTQRELRELTKLNTPSVATTLSRLKKQGRVKVTGTSITDGSVYAFVK
jgi:hypothetical protein